MCSKSVSVEFRVAHRSASERGRVLQGRIPQGPPESPWLAAPHVQSFPPFPSSAGRISIEDPGFWIYSLRGGFNHVDGDRGDSLGGKKQGQRWRGSDQSG